MRRLKQIAVFVLFNAIKNHEYFNGISIPEGVKRIIDNSETVEEFEKSMIALLEDDDKYVHKILQDLRSM